MANPCAVCKTPTANEVIINGVSNPLCSAACRSRLFAQSERRERVADWTTYSANEHGLAGRRSEMYIQGVRVEVYLNTEYANHTEVYFLDDLRRDDVAALRSLVAMLREARIDPPVGAPQPSRIPPLVVLYPVETSAKWISTIVRKLAEHDT